MMIDLLKREDEYIHRNIRTNCSYNNSLSHLNTDFHLANPVDEINAGEELLSGAPPAHLIGNKNEKRNNDC
jgi:hypothetical protein